MMKKNIKRVLVGVAALVMAVSCFSGCGKQTETTDDGKVTISIGGCPDETVDPEQYERFKKDVEDFEALYPHIKIEMDTYTFDTQTFMAKAEGNTLPTLFYVPFTEAKKVIDNGYAADITEEYKARGFYENTNDFMMENISRDDKVYLLPTGCYDVGLIMNLELLEKAGYVSEDGTPHEPQTWTEMAEMAVKIKEETGKAGFILPTINNTGGWRFTPIAWSFGVEFMKKNDDGKWIATFDTPECVEALQFIKDLKWKYDVLPANTLIDNSELQKQMAMGECAMAIGEVNQVNYFTEYGLDLNSVGAVRIPSGPKRRVSLMGGGYDVVNKNATPEQIKAVFDWEEFGGLTMELNDEVKATIQRNIEKNLERNHIVGIETLNPWKSDSEIRKYEKEEFRKNANVNMNHIKLYNDKTDVEYQAEEPVEAQALYAALDTCVQEVLNNKNANCEELIKKAAEDFQKNQLDYVE